MIHREIISFFINRHKKFSLIMSACGLCMAFFLTVIFPAMAVDSAELISSSWPQIMKDMFGDPVHGFTDVYGWIQLEIFHITFWLFVGVFASLLSSDIIAGEFENKTIDMVLACPVTRSETVLNSLIGLVVLTIVTVLPVCIGCILGILVLKLDLHVLPLVLSTLHGMLLSLLLGGITLLVSVFLHSRVLAVFIGLGTGAVFFLFNQMILPLLPGLKVIAWASPFTYYNTAGILIHGHYPVSDPLLLFTGFAAVSALSALAFNRRDILY